jgi:virginiamycin A acetyltransferase
MTAETSTAASSQAQSSGALVRGAIKSTIRGLATLLMLPTVLFWWLESRFIGLDRATEYCTEGLAMMPGLSGRYLRRAFLGRVLKYCHPTAEIGFGVIFSKVDATVAENVYIGPRCHIGLAHLERDVLIGAGVHVISGAQTHGLSDPTIPIREQEGIRTLVRIGAGAWIGSTAVIMADVGAGTVVGAGSVVTRPLPENVIAAGVPARVLRSRDGNVPAV